MLVLQTYAHLQFRRNSVASIQATAKIQRQVLTNHIVVDIAVLIERTGAVSQSILQRIAERPPPVAIDVTPESDIGIPNASQTRHVRSVARSQMRMAEIQQLETCLKRGKSEDAVIYADGRIERIRLRSHEQAIASTPPSLDKLLVAHADVEEMAYRTASTDRIQKFRNTININSISAFCVHRHKRHRYAYQ